MELWKPVVGYETRYKVSDEGRVWSVKHGRTLSLIPTKDGHLSINLWNGEKSKTHLVHRLVADAFLGPKPDDKPHTRHLNGDGADNRLSNLQYGTASENAHDKFMHGRGLTGERVHNSVLNSDLVRSIRVLNANGERVGQIARQLGLKFGTVDAVVKGRTWKHVSLESFHEVEEEN